VWFQCIVFKEWWEVISAKETYIFCKRDLYFGMYTVHSLERVIYMYLQKQYITHLPRVFRVWCEGIVFKEWCECILFTVLKGCN